MYGHERQLLYTYDLNRLDHEVEESKGFRTVQMGWFLRRGGREF